jgi:hypothetical protein
METVTLRFPGDLCIYGTSAAGGLCRETVGPIAAGVTTDMGRTAGSVNRTAPPPRG